MLLELLLLNDDWPVDRDRDDHLTCEARVEARAEPGGWGLRGGYRVITDKWTGPHYYRADEAEAVVVSPWGIEVGALVAGDLGGGGLQGWCHDSVGEPHTVGSYEPGHEVRPLAVYRDHGELWWADARWWGDGWRAAVGPQVAWSGRGLELRARVGLSLSWGDQLSAAAETWRQRGPPLAAEVRAAYGSALVTIEWSEGQVRGGLGVRF